MRYFFFLLFTIPVLEAVVIVRLVEAFGLVPALLLVFVTGIVGIGLARSQGFSVALKIREDLAAGRMPAPRMIDGVMILVAGALLITPGLITDLAGLSLLVPGVRNIVRQWMRARVEKWLRDGHPNIVVKRF